MSKSSVNPVKVSQVLYNERCISEEILDEMEEFQGTLEEKKKTLLSAIHTAVFSNHRKLKEVANGLSKFPETHLLSENIMSKYSKKFLT